MHISILSRVQDLSGRLLLGAPESWGMPSDLYFEQGDRAHPTSDELMQSDVLRARVEQHHFGRHLALIAGAVGTLASALVCLGLIPIISLIH